MVQKSQGPTTVWMVLKACFSYGIDKLPTSTGESQISAINSIICCFFWSVHTYTRWWETQILFIFIPTWGDDPISPAYVSNWLKPPIMLNVSGQIIATENTSFHSKKWSFWGVLGILPFEETPISKTINYLRKPTGISAIHLCLTLQGLRAARRSGWGSEWEVGKMYTSKRRWNMASFWKYVGYVF